VITVDFEIKSNIVMKISELSKEKKNPQIVYFYITCFVFPPPFFSIPYKHTPLKGLGLVKAVKKKKIPSAERQMIPHRSQRAERSFLMWSPAAPSNGV